MRIDSSSFNLPFEDRHQTKEIVRMHMALLSNAIENGSSIKEIHQLIKLADKEIQKLGNPDVKEAFSQLSYTINHHYPISSTTNWDVIQKIGNCISYIDEKTIY